ncbi:MAG: hypothetical protein BWY15_02013 [Firmicutes bacterium ADurb.Bin193]|nr:MAG: hypothetical protein BWY15_02013 [Firmicutes bacterium ADurb.Bin193]
MKKAFTYVEVLMAAGILSMVITIGLSLLLLMNQSLYDGQVESSNISNLGNTIYYITREIQSAEGIKISADGKKLTIKQRGSGKYSLTYSFVEHYPVSYLAFREKRLLDADYSKSGFSFDSKCLKITLAIYKNNTETNQIPQELEINILPRSKSVLTEVDD